MRTLILFLLIPWCGQWAFAVPARELSLNQPVVDQAQVLSAAERETLSAQLHAWRDQKRMQAAVVLVNSTDGEAVFDYAMAIFDRWQLGDAQTDNGLLLVIAISQREFFTLTGDGLEGALPDILVKKIQREKLVPAFRQGKFAAGIEQTLQAFAEQLAADPESQQRLIQSAIPPPVSYNHSQKKQPLDPVFILPWAAFALFFITMLIRRIFGRFIASVGSFAAGLFSFSALFFWLELGLATSIALAVVAWFFSFVTAVGESTTKNGLSRGGWSSSSSGRSRSSRSSSRSYSGGGGRSSGGGAGGSW